MRSSNITHTVVSAHTSVATAFARLRMLSQPTDFLDPLALPRPLGLSVFARVPVDSRMLCVGVCRGWRAFLSDEDNENSLWKELIDVSPSCVDTFSEAILLAAVVKAKGRLRGLDVSGRDDFVASAVQGLSFGVLRAIVTTNAATLTELRASGRSFSLPELVTLLERAPNLSCFTADAYLTSLSDSAVLNARPLFAPLRLRGLHINALNVTDPAATPETCFEALSSYPCLEELTLSGIALAPAPAAEALADACAALRVSSLRLQGCGCGSAASRSLARLLAHGALRRLVVYNWGVPMFEASGGGGGGGDAFAAALRASPSLVRLSLNDVGRHEGVDAAAAALAGGDSEDDEGE